MLISEFSRLSELPHDTIRFYIRRGLLHPKTTSKGGSRPYQIFDATDVSRARMIRTQQALGFSLKAIARYFEEYDNGEVTPERAKELAQTVLEELNEKSRLIQAMTRFMRAKIEWLETGGEGPMPDFNQFLFTK